MLDLGPCTLASVTGRTLFDPVWVPSEANPDLIYHVPHISKRPFLGFAKVLSMSSSLKGVGRKDTFSKPAAFADLPHGHLLPTWASFIKVELMTLPPKPQQHLTLTCVVRQAGHDTR